MFTLTVLSGISVPCCMRVMAIENVATLLSPGFDFTLPTCPRKNTFVYAHTISTFWLKCLERRSTASCLLQEFAPGFEAFRIMTFQKRCPSGEEHQSKPPACLSSPIYFSNTETSLPFGFLYLLHLFHDLFKALQTVKFFHLFIVKIIGSPIFSHFSTTNNGDTLSLRTSSTLGITKEYMPFTFWLVHSMSCRFGFYKGHVAKLFIAGFKAGFPWRMFPVQNKATRPALSLASGINYPLSHNDAKLDACSQNACKSSSWCCERPGPPCA